MKLRNKKTGEIDDYLFESVNNRVDLYKRQTDNVTKDIWQYNSLAEFNEEWEDYEDDDLSKIIECIDKGLEDEILPISVNDFVEKLKAWKRLKDKGFRFDDFVRNAIYFNLDEEQIQNKSILKDLDLLFGGEDGE